MSSVWLIPAVLQVVLPIGLVMSQARRRDKDVVTWLLKTVTSSAYMIAIGLAGLWLIASWYSPVILLSASVAAAAWRAPGQGVESVQRGSPACYVRRQISHPQRPHHGLLERVG